MKKKNIIGAVLVALVLCIVPLIVSAKKYEIGLNTYSWFSNSETSYDFFLYWKGQLLILLCGILALYVAVKGFIVRGEKLVDKSEYKILIPAFVYFVMALGSTLLSGNRDMAIWGGYEQWEGMMIIGVYVILMLLTYHVLIGKTEIRIVAVALLPGVLVLSLLSALQAFGQDFFRTPSGQSVMNFMLADKLKFTFNFDLGRVYSTLYNPNYVGSYVALMLPIIISLISIRKKLSAIAKNILIALIAVCLVIMLLGSESVTGFIGVFAVFVLFVVMMIPNIKTKPIPFMIGGALCVVAIVVTIVTNKSIFDYGVNKVINPAPNNIVIKSMESKGGVLFIKTEADDLLKLAVYVKDGSYSYEATDDKGKEAGIYYERSAEEMRFSDTRFNKIVIAEKKFSTNEGDYNGMVISTPSVNQSYSVVLDNEDYVEGGLIRTEYKMFNPFSKVDQLRKIESVGFSSNQHFGSRRGYIWSRTIPLLKKYIFLGSGPNTFVCVFPNDDYVGMQNVGYGGSIVTKPHNLYLQIFVQTGLISLLAFLALYGAYFVDCIRLYYKKTRYSSIELFGLGIMLGTFGYLVTGLANDSTVAVAPLYWCLLGVGMAVNRYNRSTGEMTK